MAAEPQGIKGIYESSRPRWEHFAIRHRVPLVVVFDWGDYHNTHSIEPSSSRGQRPGTRELVRGGVTFVFD